MSMSLTGTQHVTGSVCSRSRRNGAAGRRVSVEDITESFSSRIQTIGATCSCHVDHTVCRWYALYQGTPDVSFMRTTPCASLMRRIPAASLMRRRPGASLIRRTRGASWDHSGTFSQGFNLLIPKCWYHIRSKYIFSCWWKYEHAERTLVTRSYHTWRRIIKTQANHSWRSNNTDCTTSDKTAC